MHFTKRTKSPMVTLLSSSTHASRRAQNLLESTVGLIPEPITVASDDELNAAFKSSIPGFSRKWFSVSSKCPQSRTILHFISLDSQSHKTGPFGLLGVSNVPTGVTPNEGIEKFRDLLASHVKDRSTAINLSGSLGSTVSPASLLKSVSTGGLPLLDFPEEESFGGDTDGKGVTGLKEVVVPFFDYAQYNDGSTLLSRMSKAKFSRPTVGVYQWPGSATHIRPLPMAAEDQQLPPPSLIFHSVSPKHTEDVASKAGVHLAKIGYGGSSVGQKMLIHPDLHGLDIRCCTQDTFSSSFAEAQESLLAASIDELQSTNTLLAGGESGEDDERIGNGDCWVEFRANLRRPSGFWQRPASSMVTKNRTVKAPDLPFE